MSDLTPEILDSYPLSRYANDGVIQRGKQYFRKDKVFEIEVDGSHAHCLVEGSYDEDYEVQIHLRGESQLNTSCTCPHAAQVLICKHIVASIMAVSDLLKTTSKPTLNNWERKLNNTLENLPKQKNARKAKPYLALFFLQRQKYYQKIEFSLSVRILKESIWINNYIADKDPAEIHKTLKATHNWERYIDRPYRKVNPAGCLNLPSEGISIFNFIIQAGGYYAGIGDFTAYLPLLAKMNATIFLVDGYDEIQSKIDILPEPVEIKAALIQNKNGYMLQAGVDRDGKIYTSAKENLDVVSENPPWVLLGENLVSVTNPESLALLSAFPLQIPFEEEEHFRSTYLSQLAERLPFEGDLVSYDDVDEIPVPRLYLRKEKDELVAQLRFGYGDYETLADSKPAPVKMEDVPGSWALTRIYRKPEQEFAFYDMLKGATFGLKRAGSYGSYGEFLLRAKTHPYDFLTKSIPALTEAGFEIYGDKDTLGKLNKNTPSISLNITSGIDWFDLDVKIQYGEQEVLLKDLRKAIKRGENFIKLADGSIGQIPEMWLERYKHLFNMTKETDDGFRVRDYQLTLLDELLADAAEKNVVPEFIKKRDRLRNLKEITEQPSPKGFTGELRPYQKAGLDWLHFLREYGFGGILADDMGLGKTIQMLAYLQNQREQAKVTSAALLVVPKSLLTNWQRESAKFTPNLRILEYIGIEREKEISVFDGYDIVITTYGTMLRDIEILREYRFGTIILDESQAIKNPLAKTSKAARLLNGKHRLAMTGTPVENNSFELWSQFAFLNPGLLGNLDYFKQDFAKAIESRDGEQEAALLKRMVYPFILRRTKKQVAPELPPRTERIIYTDFEPAQRKLYDQTRDRYRAQLMGVLDDAGMNNARMQILEGLLRLRQICIHPALVEPAYNKGVAKFEILLETMETLRAEGHKALIFSQFVQTLKLLEKEMKPAKMKYTYLDGKTRKRQERVDEFQNDPKISFFLISLKAGGVGLNLTAADYVIHLDPWWNPAVEMQATDRAHRIGQDKPVFVYKLIARDTVEEKILKLQERKKALVEQLISSESSFFKSLTKDDVEVLFS